jgi:hypothetical protein
MEVDQPEPIDAPPEDIPEVGVEQLLLWFYLEPHSKNPVFKINIAESIVIIRSHCIDFSSEKVSGYFCGRE